MNFPGIESPSACSSRRKENPNSNLEQRQFRQPQRGCLFIGERALCTPSFCFSAAHKQRGRIDRHIAETLCPRSHLRLLAPPKNKKNKASGARLAINRPPRWGGNSKDSQNLPEEYLWVKSSSALRPL
jgi:hypothetical protein